MPPKPVPPAVSVNEAVVLDTVTIRGCADRASSGNTTVITAVAACADSGTARPIECP